MITARKRSLRRLCFYTCLSVILFKGGWCLVPGGAWSQGVPGPGGCLVLRGVPGEDPPGTATAAVGRHPTEMHSCLILQRQNSLNLILAVWYKSQTCPFTEFVSDVQCVVRIYLNVCCNIPPQCSVMCKATTTDKLEHDIVSSHLMV